MPFWRRERQMLRLSGRREKKCGKRKSERRKRKRAYYIIPFARTDKERSQSGVSRIGSCRKKM